jgi:PAS domain S-box-containing protein
MPILTPIVSILFITAILISINAGSYLISRYRTRLAIWCGFILLSQAIELGCYLLRLVKPAATADMFLFLFQVLSYSLFCFFWLLFVFCFTRHSQWIRLHNLALILSVPATYLLMMVVRWYQGLVANPPETAITGSLMVTSPLAMGTTGAILFFIYGYSIAFSTIFVLLRFYLIANRSLRKLIIPLLGGPILMALAGFLEVADLNPFKPISIHQLACMGISFLAFWMIIDLRFGNVLSNAREVVIGQLQDGVIILDQQDRIVYVNPSAQQIIGKNSEHALRQDLSNVWPKGSSLIAGQFNVDFPTGEITIAENGVNNTFDINVSQLFDAYHEHIGRTIVLRNVTGRERMEKALDERSRELQRTNALLSALAEVNVILQTTTEPIKIYSILGEELKKLGLVCFIAQLDPVTNDLYISYFSAQSKLINQVEKLLGIKHIGFHLDKDQFSKLYDILGSKKPSYKPLLKDDLKDVPGKLSTLLLEQGIRLLGLKTEMATLILPLVTSEHNYGLMGIWGENLSETDTASFRIFASQVAYVIERAILYESEIHRSSELARVNSLVIALSRVASIVGTTSKSEFIFDTLGKELTKAGLNCAVVSIDPAGEAAFIKYLSFNPDIIEGIENLTGIQIKNYKIPKKFWPSDRIITEKIPVWYTHPNEVFRKMFPIVPNTIAKKAFQLLKFNAEDQLCILPLVIGERTIGAMPIWGSDLRPSDDPIINIFASQVAGILQNLSNYELETQRADELARSNAMIVALSNVATQLDTTTNIPQVFTTLGNELKKVRVNCMIGTLDNAKQVMKIEYLSVTPEVIQWAEKLGVFWPKEIKIPRRLWPTDKAVTEKAPYWDPDPLGSTSRMFPFVPKKVFYKTFEMAGMNPNDPVCYLPMISEEEVIGILAVWGPDIRNEDIPGFSVFANQVATAMKNTWLYNQAQQEITERRKAQIEREKLIAELEEKNSELEQFTYTVSHDLKAPLFTIRGFLGYVEKDALTGNTERLKADIARISEATDKMKRLLNELLELSRIGRIMNPPQAVTFEAIVQEALALVRGNIQERGVQILVAPQLPTVYGDRARLVQVVQNLVDNAVKFMGEQTDPKIEIGQGGDEAGKPILYVKDNGIGIAQGLFDKIFRLFNKLDANTEGTGVGLALVKRIIEVHGGRIWVESEGAGLGATFYFTIPGNNSDSLTQW